MNSKPSTWRRFRLALLGPLALSGLGAGGAARAAPECAAGPLAASRANAASLSTLAWAPSARTGVGWELYAPLVGQEIGSDCPPDSPGFAAALSRWQLAHKRSAGGTMNAPTLQAMNQVWLARRPFVKASAQACPPPPPLADLATAAQDESYGGKTIQLRARALGAYRAMVAAARRDLPQLSTDKRLMTIFSAFRDPDADAARCAAEQNCQGVVRAACSAHRTGLAIDLDLGAAPGARIDSADDANRLYISRGASYRWLVRNAGRFGFVPYPFEPWHWEWTGEAP